MQPGFFFAPRLSGAPHVRGAKKVYGQWACSGYILVWMQRPEALARGIEGVGNTIDPFRPSSESVVFLQLRPGRTRLNYGAGDAVITDPVGCSESLLTVASTIMFGFSL